MVNVTRHCRNTALSTTRLLSTRRSLATPHHQFLCISHEVQQALAENKPVVALESTIFTHGYPFPQNVTLASRLESLVRSNGGVPATIGILDGVAHVGLESDDLERLAHSTGQCSTLKVSRRDLAFACAAEPTPGQRYNGGTTVAGTMMLAHLAGIKIFATGGLGGVHRGAQNTMDISADLTELGRTSVAVISSGCKQFLDIPRTLEYLETEGVPVATFAQGRLGDVDFPAFWSRDSGFKSPMVLRDDAEAAAVIHAQHTLGINTGLLFANPIPAEHSIPNHEISHAIESALQQALEDNIVGNASTPYVLAKIRELTDSRSVTANTALVESNVVRGTCVAKELAKLQDEIRSTRGLDQQSSAVMTGPAAENYTSQGLMSRCVSEAPQISSHATRHVEDDRSRAESSRNVAKVFVAGSVAVDFSCDYLPSRQDSWSEPVPKTSNPSRIVQSLGGVAHNVALAAQLAGVDTRLCTAVGNDLAGSAILDALLAEGLDTSLVETFNEARTPQYVAINDANNELVMAMSDMTLLDGQLKDGELRSDIETAFDTKWNPELQRSRPSIVAIDANWQPDMLTRWLKAAHSIGATTVFEPVSNAKSERLFAMRSSYTLTVWPHAKVDIASPNAFELAAMHAAAKRQGFFERDDWWQVIDSMGIPSSGIRKQLALATSNQLVDQGIPQQCIQLLPFMPAILAKLGSAGVLLAQILPPRDQRLQSGAAAPYVLSRNVENQGSERAVGGLYMRLFPAVDRLTHQEIVSVNGVGDTFLGVMIAALAARGKTARIEEVVDVAQMGALMTLKSKAAVSPEVQALRALLFVS